MENTQECVRKVLYVRVPNIYKGIKVVNLGIIMREGVMYITMLMRRVGPCHDM